MFISREGAKRKYGVWEDGKKVRWFSREEVAAIESGEVEDMREVFQENPDLSVDKIRDFAKQFLPPAHFYQARQRLISKIKELKIPVEVPLLVVDEQQQEEEEDDDDDAQADMRAKRRR